MKIPPLSDPVWRERVAALVAIVRGAKKPIGTRALELEVRQRLRWTGDVYRHTLAAAHPQLLEWNGRWGTPRMMATRRKPIDVDLDEVG